MKQMATWVGIIAVIIIAVVGLIMLSNSASTQPPPQTSSSSMPKISKTDNMQGDPKLKVQVVEYADFQCPACGAEYPILHQIKADYKNKVLFVYRYFPLLQVHKNAMIAAQAAYAASKQGKFWEMHDLLYQHQNEWADTTNAADTFKGYAKQLTLGMDQYQRDFSSSDAQKVINDSETAGIAAGVNATPTFFINGRKLESNIPPSYEQLKQLINDQLAKK